MSSLPVPLSPVMRIVVLSGATVRTVRKTSCIFGDRPMMFSTW
jgi:hypothetical protein